MSISSRVCNRNVQGKPEVGSTSRAFVFFPTRLASAQFNLLLCVGVQPSMTTACEFQRSRPSILLRENSEVINIHNVFIIFNCANQR